MNATILLVAAIQGLLLSFALIMKKSASRNANIYFSIILILFSLELIFAWGGETGYNNHKGAFPIWLLLSYLVLPPSIWLFFKHNTVIQFKFKPTHLLLYVPAALEITIRLLQKYTTASTILATITKSTYWFLYCEWLPLLATIVVLIMLARNIGSITRQFKGNANPSVRQHMLKMYSIFLFFCTLTLLWIVVTVFNNRLFIIIEAIFTGLFFLLGYIAFFKPDLFDMPKLFHSKKKHTGEFASYDDEAIFLQLTMLFEQDKIYTQPKLTVKEVADELALPAKYVSYLINTYACSGFNDFVNAYRVKEVLQMIKVEKSKTLLGIAMDAGFNSKSTFNQVFKQVTGKSPSEYLA